jgi:hypothetical protein
MLKIDYEKAFDSIDWKFLMFMLKKFGFNDIWLRWVKACVCGGHLLILANGSPTYEVKIGRGLKQGDMLAPFLFLIAIEGLGGLVRNAIDFGFFSGIRIGVEGPIVSILQFVDDTVICREATQQNLWVLKSVLRSFELVSAMKINYHNNCVLGVNADNDFLQIAAKFLHCKVVSFLVKYLDV